MTDPITATVIATIAFTKLTETLSEKLGESVYLQVSRQVKTLRELIAKRFTGNDKAEVALAKAENGSEDGVADVAKILQPVIEADPVYGEELKTLTQEIQQQINIESMSGEQIQNNYGGTNFQTKVEGGEVYQGNITINKT